MQCLLLWTYNANLPRAGSPHMAQGHQYTPLMTERAEKRTGDLECQKSVLISHGLMELDRLGETLFHETFRLTQVRIHLNLTGMFLEASRKRDMCVMRRTIIGMQWNQSAAFIFFSAYKTNMLSGGCSCVVTKCDRRCSFYRTFVNQ